MDDEIEVLDLYVDDKKQEEQIETEVENVLSSSIDSVVSLEKNGLFDRLVVSKGYWFVVFLTIIVIIVLFIMMFK